MKKLLVLAAALAVVLTMFSFPVVAMANSNTDSTTPTVPAEEKPAEVNTSFIEPNYYPDYDVVEEAAPETAPKTGDFSMLPQFMMAAAAAGSLAVACKRAK